MKHWTTLLLLPLLCAACSKNTDEAADPATRSIEVAIGSGPRLDIRPQSTTRTELGDDGVSVKWQTGDRLALWAVNSAAQTVVDAVAFSLYHYNATYNSANFRGSIPQMAEDTYTYYAVSPVPASTDGLRASYDIPAVQDGTFHGEWDVMVATPIEGAAALREHDKKDPSGISDNTDIVNLLFAHKMHVLKITIPRNDLGEPISEIKLTFPTPVVGRLTVDAANPAAAAELSESSNTLTLRFSEPKEAEDVVYALIAPVTLEEGQEVSIVASSSTLESEERTFAPAGRTFAAGHTTPISYNVPAAAVQLTQLIFTLAETGVNTLGEAIDRALGAKAGIARYGFALPMDDCRALVLLDFGGRIDFEWEARFRRERIGDVPTELFRHFFHALCSAARCNLQIAARGENEHHKAEAIFKAFARALRMAVARQGFGYDIPSSKGVL